MIDEVILSASVALSTALLVVSSFLLSKFRSMATQLNASNDISKELWNALDTRLRKQDERILDVITRMDVAQSRVVERESHSAPHSLTAIERPPREQLLRSPPPLSRLPASSPIEPTESNILGLLVDRPRTSVEIKALIGKSREHTARLMKSLFDRGLVGRNDSRKPFVYQVTGEGKRYLSEG